MKLFNLLFLGHQIEHYYWHELGLAYCKPYTLIVSSLKLEDGLKNYVRNVAETKYEFVELVKSFLLFTTCKIA